MISGVAYSSMCWFLFRRPTRCAKIWRKPPWVKGGSPKHPLAILLYILLMAWLMFIRRLSPCFSLTWMYMTELRFTGIAAVRREISFRLGRLRSRF